MKSIQIHPADIIKDIGPADLRGLNVVLINMPLRETAAPNVTPQGPLLLATILQNSYCVNATLIDLNGYRINGRHLTESEIRQLITKHFEVHGEPDLVGFSGMITTLRWQEKIAKIVRELAPITFLVSGGGLATELKAGLFNYIPDLDGIICSEGEDVIIKAAYDAKILKETGFIRAINSGKLAPYYIGSVVGKGEIFGRHRFVYEGDRPKNLDLIPFADLDFLKEDVFGNKILENYIGNSTWGAGANNSSAVSFTMSRSTTFVSSRGCPYACAFCYRGAQGERNYGMRSAQNLAKEFKLHIEKYDVDFIGMVDDNFAVDYKRIADLVPLLKPLNIRWGTHARLDESKGFNLMAEAGCTYIGFGAESASPRVLKAMNKGGFILKKGLSYGFPRTMVEGIINCESAGIHANCTWIMGYPTETLEDLKMSVAFIKWQEDFYTSLGKSADSVNKKMFTATWYPGTEMGHQPKVQKILREVFGISFNFVGEPVCDENLHQYILELDDATKLLHSPKTDKPLNYSEMPDDIFLQARKYIDSGKVYKILEM
ncbi:MAG: radical SAM protein [Candidatus Azambacteria bacterium]|nr:radical SAM protein [Candidatus Azambacteria bacterium]